MPFVSSLCVFCHAFYCSCCIRACQTDDDSAILYASLRLSVCKLENTLPSIEDRRQTDRATKPTCRRHHAAPLTVLARS